MSTTWFAKIDCNFHSNRKAMKAGRLGREVYIFVLCINAQRGALGEFPAEDLDPWYVSRQLQMEEDEASEGIQRCIQERLIEIDDGLVRIVGWTDDYAKYPLGAAEKQKRYRDRHSKRTVKGSEPHHSVTALPDRSNALPDPVTPLPPVTQEGRKEGREGERGAPDPLAFDPHDPPQRGQLAQKTWSRLSEIRLALGKEFGIAGVMGLTTITPGTEVRGFRDLRDRIREEGAEAPRVCDRVLESITARARETRSIEWVSEKATTEGAWRTAKERIPKWIDAQRAPSTEDKPKTFTSTVRTANGLVRITEDASGQVISTEPVMEASA